MRHIPRPDQAAPAPWLAAALHQLALDLDALVEASVVLLLNQTNDRLVGTGFLIAPQVLLTCDHVARSGVPLVADHRQQRVLLGAPSGHCPELDLALYRLSAALGQPLAVGGRIRLPAALRGRAAAARPTGYVDSSPFVLQVVGRARFKHRGLDATATPGLDLEGSGIRPGASGSPLVAASERAAAAVVVGGNDDVHRVWAVEVADAGERFPALAAVLLENDRVAARYGSALNALGACVLFSMAAEARRADLAREQRYLEELDVPRRHLLDWLDEFRGSKSPVMAVVGPANVGKSWALGAWSMRAASGEVRLLLQAGSFDASPAPLEDIVVARVLAAVQERCPQDAGVRLLAAQQLGASLAAAGVRLTIVLDAINEAPDWERLAAIWLPQAVAWCVEHQVKLVISCREESWATMAVASRLASNQFFRPASALPSEGTASQGTRTPGGYSASGWCVPLRDFDDVEARAAADRYGLKPADDPGGHPLMYRIAKALHIDDAGESSRLQLLLRYVTDRLARIGSRHRMGQLQQRLLEDALQRLADQLPPGGEGGVPTTEAQRIVGDARLLEDLVDEGVLSSGTTHVRFRHDQLADAMRTVLPEALRGFKQSLADEQSRPKAADIATATITLLRLESDQRQAEYRQGIRLLLDAIAAVQGGRHPNEDLMAGAERVARALPRRCIDDMRAIHAAIVRHGCRWRGATACTENARLPASERAALLLELMPHTSMTDETGFPVRWKDWQDGVYRRYFENDAALDRSTVLAALRRLLRRHSESVLDVVWTGLGDRRRIGNEASIASACAGLLHLESPQQLDTIVQRLVVTTGPSRDPDALPEGCASLAWHVVADHQSLVAPLLARAWKQGLDSPLLVQMICQAASAGSNELWPAVEDLFYRLRDVPLRRASAQALARTIHAHDPDETAGWDVMTSHWHPYGSSGALPPARLEQAIARMAEEGVGFAEFVVSGHIGTREQQRPLVRGVASALAVDHAQHRFGRFIEQHLDRLERDRVLQRPWLALALLMVKDPACAYREPLVFRAFSCVHTHWSDRLRRHLIDQPDSAEWPATVGALAKWPTDEEAWSPWYQRARLRHGAQEVDQLAWIAIAADVCDSERRLPNAQRLVSLWRLEPTHSPTAADILGRLQSMESSLQSLEHLLDEQAGNGH